MRCLFTVIAVFAFVISVPAAVLNAHEGHPHKVMGIVTTIHENHLEVKDAKGVVTRHLLDVRTKVKRGKTALRATDIKVGDRVVVASVESKDLAGKKVVRVTEVQLGTAAATARK